MPITTTLGPSWQKWIVASLQQSRSQTSIVAEMASKNIDVDFASVVVGKLAANLSAEGCQAGKNSHYAREASRIPERNVILTGGRAVPVLMRIAVPEVIVFGDVLSQDECDALIRRAQPKLERSRTISSENGDRIVIPERTSFGTYFDLLEDDFISCIDRRFSELVNWPVQKSEGLQILRYKVGDEYKPHFDYFPPNQMASIPQLARGGQRVASLVVYLNNAADGGETIFPEIGLSVVPRAGHAVYFSYCNSQQQLDPLTLHGSAPVRQGEKWIATKWLRQDVFSGHNR